MFCDDDNWLDENYLHLGLNSMKSNSKIGALGGTGYPVFENEEPPYFWANQYHALAVGIQSDIEGDITDGRGVLYGAGMILNKTAFNILEGKYRFKFQLSDRTGTNLVSSGDHELCLALKKIGFRIYYLKKLTFNHFITRQRTTISYYKKLFLAFGIAYAMLHVYRVKVHTLKNWNNDYRYLCLRAFKNMLIVWIRLLLNGYYFKPEKYKHIDQLHKLYANIGILKTFLKVKNTYQQQFRDNPIFNIETYNKKD